MKFVTALPATLTIVLVFTFTFIFSQECTVETASLKGIYSGDCKNGKASGKGKATGTDRYEGDFKAGMPDGQGTYVWSNGNSYIGKFVKGLRDGKGVMAYKRPNAADSVVEGYWKKDNYTGKYEKPFVVIFKSKSVTDVEVEEKKNSFRQITFFVTNTSGGASTTTGEMPRMTVDDIQLTKGSYGRTMSNNDHAKKTEFILYDVIYPVHMKVTIGTELVELELNEEASYIVDVRINQ